MYRLCCLKKLLLLDYSKFTDEVLQDCPENNNAVNIMDVDNIVAHDASNNWSDYTPAKLKTSITTELLNTVTSSIRPCIAHSPNMFDSEK